MDLFFLVVFLPLYTPVIVTFQAEPRAEVDRGGVVGLVSAAEPTRRHVHAREDGGVLEFVVVDGCAALSPLCLAKPSPLTRLLRPSILLLSVGSHTDILPPLIPSRSSCIDDMSEKKTSSQTNFVSKTNK